jgi:hypothetical protein
MGRKTSIHMIILSVVSALRAHIATRIAENTNTPAMKMGAPYNGVNAAEDKVGTYVGG